MYCATLDLYPKDECSCVVPSVFKQEKSPYNSCRGQSEYSDLERSAYRRFGFGCAAPAPEPSAFSPPPIAVGPVGTVGVSVGINVGVGLGVGVNVGVGLGLGVSVGFGAAVYLSLIHI